MHVQHYCRQEKRKCNIAEIGKGGGPRSHDYGKVIAEELGHLDANMSGGGGC